MVDRLLIGGHVVADIIAHARAEAPLECCGLLAGQDGRIDECIRTVNARASPSAYLIDPADHFAAIRRLRRERRQLVGTYHSHPRSPAVPSDTDLREAHYPEFVYLIVSLEDDEAPDVRGFAIRDGACRPVPLVAVPSGPVRT